MLSLNWIPGAQRLVSFGGEPAFIPDGLLQAIRRHVEEINGSSGGLYDGLKQVETPQIERIPFAGYENIFDYQLPGSERTSILFKLLNENPRIPVGLPVG